MKVIKSTVAMVLSLSLLSTSCMTSKCSATQEATNTESTASKDSSKGKDILINQQSGNSFSNQELEKLLNEKFERQQQEEKEEKDKDSNYKEKVIYMAVGAVIGVLVPLILKGTIKTCKILGKGVWRSGNRLLFGGYNSLKDSKDNLKKVLSSSSNEIIYGQEEAKKI